jgi:adenosine deaminase CECR1
MFITPFLLEGQDSPSTSRSMDLARVFVEEIERFKASEEGKGFWGARFIWTTMRGRNSAQILDGVSSPLTPVPTLLIVTRYESVHPS